MYDPLLYILPSEEEIEETRALLIQKVRSTGAISTKKQVRFGYEAAAYVLRHRIRDPKDLSVAKLGEPTSRSIALMAVDYLNGACDRDMLLTIPYE